MTRDRLAAWLVDNGAAEYLDKRYGHMSGEDLADLLLAHFLVVPIEDDELQEHLKDVGP